MGALPATRIAEDPADRRVGVVPFPVAQLNVEQACDHWIATLDHLTTSGPARELAHLWKARR